MLAVLTKIAKDIFDPVDGSGNARGPVMAEAQTWGTEIEELILTERGFRFLFSTSVSIADPTPGYIRFNNALFASVGNIAISANSAASGNPSVAAFIRAMDDSTTTAHRGYLIVKKATAPENFAVYDITSALTDNTTWLQIGVTYVTGAGSFAADDVLSMEFSRTGDSAGRPILGSNRTYYVRTDGSDSNTGLGNTGGAAFLTIQKAIDTVATLDLSGYDVTIQVDAGTYTGLVVVANPWVGKGTVTLLGDATTPSNVVLSTAGVAISLSNRATLSISGLKITTSALQGLLADTSATLTIAGKMDFGACASVHMLAQNKATIVGGAALTAYTISGAAARHWQAASQGTIYIASVTITISGTPAFSSQFALASRLGYIQCNSITFSGSATGTRYSSDLNSVIYTGGGGSTYLPGDVGGASTNGGQYA